MKNLALESHVINLYFMAGYMLHKPAIISVSLNSHIAPEEDRMPLACYMLTGNYNDLVDAAVRRIARRCRKRLRVDGLTPHEILDAARKVWFVDGVYDNWHPFPKSQEIRKWIDELY